jgi:SAM-dependent methyltransferase
MQARMSVKHTVRRALAVVGLEVYGARGGLYFCRGPHAGAAGPAWQLPDPCRIRLRRAPGRSSGTVEVDGIAPPAGLPESDFIRLPMLPDAHVDEIRLIDVYEHLYRHDRRSAIREWRRVLRPGGSLLIHGLPDFEAIAAAFVSAEGRGDGTAFGLDEVFRRTHGDPATADGPQHLLKDAFTRESVTAELTEAGYDIVGIERVRRDGDPAPLWLDVVARRRR